MRRTRSTFAVRYTPEFRNQVAQLVQAGRKVSQLAQEFGCSSWSVTRWVRQAERDAGRGDGGLTSEERHEFARLRRENRHLKLERDCCAHIRSAIVATSSTKSRPRICRRSSLTSAIIRSIPQLHHHPTDEVQYESEPLSRGFRTRAGMMQVP
jgi:transposase